MDLVVTTSRPTAAEMILSVLRRWRATRWPLAESITAEGLPALNYAIRIHLATGAGRDIRHAYVDVTPEALTMAGALDRLAELLDDAYRLAWPLPAEWTRRRFRIGRHDWRRLAT